MAHWMVNLRKDGGKVFETDAALTSGVGGVSYAVQGIVTLMVALPINTPPSQYMVESNSL